MLLLLILIFFQAANGIYTGLHPYEINFILDYILSIIDILCLLFGFFIFYSLFKLKKSN
jgi:hypothetical protein